MTTTTLPATTSTSPAATRPVDAVPGPTHETLRSAVPAAVAVVLLVGLLGAGVLALQRVLDFGVWLVAAQ